MAKDVLITPLDGIIQFSGSDGAGTGQIKVDSDDLVISNLVGDVLLGDGASDVFIGNGSDNVDIVFEQNGEIRDDGSGKTITLGSKTTTLILSSSSDLTLQGGGGNVGIGTSTATVPLQVEGNISASGNIITEGHITASGDISASGLRLGGGSFTLGGNTVTDAAIILPEGQKIYTFEDNQYFRNLIHKASDVIQIGQSGTALVDEIRLLPGNAGFTTFYGNTTEVVRVDLAGNITASGNISSSADFFGKTMVINASTGSQAKLTVGGAISASGDIKGSTLTGTLQTAAQGNITSLGTLTTLTVDDITINGSTISDAGTLAIDVGGDLTLDAAGNDIYFKDDGDTRFTFNLDDTPEIDVEGDLFIDPTGGNTHFDSHITASGNISASGTSHIFGGDITTTDLTATQITASIISASTRIHASDIRDFNNGHLTIRPDAELNLGTAGTDEINIGRVSSTSCDINMFANSSTPTLRIVNKQAIFAHPITGSIISASGTLISNEINTIGHITASGNISSSGNILAMSGSIGTNTIANNSIFTVEGSVSSSGTIKAATLDAAAVSDTLAAAIVAEIDNDEIPIAKLASDAITIAGTSTALGGSITADTIAGQISNDTISGNQINGGTIGTTTITALAGNLSLGDNNISNVGIIQLDSIEDDATGGDTNITINGTTLNIDVGGSTILETTATTAKFSTSITASGEISASGGLSTLSVAESSLTGSIKPVHGTFNINYGTAAQFSSSLAAAGNGYGEIISHMVVHAAVSAGDVCYNVSNVWRLADADSESTAGDVMLAVALEDGLSSGGQPVLIRGMVRLGAGHIADTSGDNGDALYLSTTAGHVAFGVPSGNGDIARIAGYCIDETNDIIYFNPSSAYVEVSA